MCHAPLVLFHIACASRVRHERRALVLPRLVVTWIACITRTMVLRRGPLPKLPPKVIYIYILVSLQVTCSSNQVLYASFDFFALTPLRSSVAQDRAVIRGSGDYYPREDASHGPHLYMNAYNAIFLSTLGVQDWDMFQTAVGRKVRCGHEPHADAYQCEYPYSGEGSPCPTRPALSGVAL